MSQNLKFVCVGGKHSGKTAFIKRVATDIFSDQKQRSADFTECEKTLNDKRVKLILHDTMGNMDANSMAPQIFRGADAVLIFYDPTSTETAAMQCDALMQRVQAQAPLAQIVIIHSKVDLGEKNEPQEYAGEHLYPFFRVSSATGVGIQEAVAEIAQVVSNKDRPEAPPKIATETQKEWKCC